MTSITALFPFRKRSGLRRLATVASLLFLTFACAPQPETFEARLSPFPVIGGNAGGLGAATATLRGTTLEVSGSFEGLTYREGRAGEVGGASAAAAGLYSSSFMAMAGERFANLTLAVEGDSGAISGSVELSSEQVEMLRDGQIYAQVDSEQAPGGHLWGWFLQ